MTRNRLVRTLGSIGLPFAIACTPTPTTPEQVAEPAPERALAPEPAPKPASEPPVTVEPTPPPKLASSDGAPLRLAYDGCLGRFRIAEVAGETFVLYGYGETGRIDRLGPDATPTKTYDLPIGAAELRYASPKGPAKGAKVPLGILWDLAGPTIDELHVVGEFYVANENWEYEVYALRNRKWVATGSPIETFHLRGDAALLGYTEDAWGHGVPYFDVIAGTTGEPSFEPILAHAHDAGAGPETLDEISGPPGVEVLSYDVARHGAILAVVAYHDEEGGAEAKPVGTWLMAWTKTGELGSIVRFTEEHLDAATVVVDGEDGYLLWGDSTAQLRRWHAGELEPIAAPTFAGGKSSACLAMYGVDPMHRLWVGCDDQIAYRDAAGWQVETLPSGGVDQIAGLEHGALWVLFADGGLWSRDESGTWTRTPYTDDRPQGDDIWDPITILKVGSDGQPWLIRQFTHGDEIGVGNMLQSSSYVYTTRSIPAPNRCR